MSVVITGWRSRIAQEFRNLIPEEAAIWGKPLEPGFPVHHPRYLFCHGLLRPKRKEDQSEFEIGEGYKVNLHSVTQQCNRIFAANRWARICIIGSESGYRGSFDEVYADAKRALHGYVETKEIGPGQQLVCISPGIISDCGMTLVRKDRDALEQRRADHPKGRFLTAAEVAKMAYTLLYEQDYITGTVIRMHGGLKDKAA